MIVKLVDWPQLCSDNINKKNFNDLKSFHECKVNRFLYKNLKMMLQSWKLFQIRTLPDLLLSKNSNFTQSMFFQQQEFCKYFSSRNLIKKVRWRSWVSDWSCCFQSFCCENPSDNTGNKTVHLFTVVAWYSNFIVVGAGMWGNRNSSWNRER